MEIFKGGRSEFGEVQDLLWHLQLNEPICMSLQQGQIKPVTLGHGTNDFET